jgi:glutamine synthetase
MSLQDAVLDAVREAVVATKAIRFEGNNYAAEWVEEARRRGIPNLRTSPEALAELVKPEAREFMARMKVFSEAETEARYHVRMERYVKDVEIEVEAMKSIVTGHVLPAAYKQLALLSAAGSSKSSKDALSRMEGRWTRWRPRWPRCRRRPAGKKAAEKGGACWPKKVVRPGGLLRGHDQIEEMVADEFWTLPKYMRCCFWSD